MRASNPFFGLSLATFSGCLWFLACTPFDLSALAWVAAVPMLLAIDRAPSLKMALALGWWAGVVETGGGFYWLIDTTQRFTEFPWAVAALVFLLFCAARAVIFLAFAGIVAGIRRRRPVPMALIAPLAMAVSEFVVPQLFPCGQWITQAWHPLVIQITELTGPIGVTALLMLVNGAVYDVLSRRGAARSSAIAAGAIMGAALIFGAVRMRQVDELAAAAPQLAIGLVQPNFAYSTDPDLSPEEATRELTALQEQSIRLERAGAKLIVWSEGAYPVPLPREITADFPADSPAMIRRGFKAPAVIGADTVKSATGDAYNTAMLFDQDGQITGLYDKVRLLAFGEYIPGLDWFPWLARLVPIGSSRFAAGAGPGILSVEGPGALTWRLGPLICYEDLLPDFIHDVGKLHPDLLVNLTSDQWFGAGSEPWEHLALSVFSTIELRVALVRAVNSGISAMIDPNGRLAGQTYADDPYRHPMPSDGMLVSAPKMAGGRTLYVAWGDWFPYGCMLAVAAVAVRSRRPPRAIGRKVTLRSP
jgi:apolipoprotein N-acyltransferase